MRRPIRLTIDFESFYDSEVSLRKMTPVEYLCHPKFHVIGAALRFDDSAPLPAPKWGQTPQGKGFLSGDDKPHMRGPRAFRKKAKWYSARELPRVFAEIGSKIGWDNIMLVSHNIGFDGCLLAWRYGILPGLYLDTLGMARASVIADSARASVDALTAYFGLPPKGSEIKHASGWTLDMFERPENRAFYLAYQRYCEHDADCAATFFVCMAWQFTGQGGKASPTEHAGEEFAVMDMVARMTIMPQFGLDTHVLSANLERILDNKASLLDTLVEEKLITLDAKGSPPELMSSDKLADLLRALGVEPPMKWSVKKKRMDYAFSKTDKEFQELLQHDDELVQMVVSARLGVKSTQEETRTQRFLDIANVVWPVESDEVFPPPLMDNPCLPAAPFPLKYSGAHTHRLSGDWGLNLQNLGRKSELRRAIVAPPGYEVVSADASQIEARIVAWLAGAHRVVNAFAQGEDVYSTLATDVYGYRVNKNDHPMERFVGKVGVLGLGFGMGAPKFQLTVWNQSERKTTIDLVLSKSTVTAYRTKLAPEVPRYWKLMEVVQSKLAARERFDFGCMFTDYDQSIVLPNGMRLYYLDMGLREVDDLYNPGQKKMSWTFRYGRETKYTFGGKTTENVVQSLARIITMGAAARIRKESKKMGITRILAGQIHDQLIYLAPTREAETLRDMLVHEMSQRRDWYSTLPLAAEGAIGPNLLEAK